MPRKPPQQPPQDNANERPDTPPVSTPITTPAPPPQAPVGGTKVLPSPGTKVKTEVNQTYEETAGPNAPTPQTPDRFAGQRPDLQAGLATGPGTIIVDFLDEYKDEPG